MKGLAIELVIIIVAVGVEQEHGGSRMPATTDPDSTAPESETPAENDRRGKRKHKTTGEGRS